MQLQSQRFVSKLPARQNSKEPHMGLGPPILALYRQLKLGGAFDGIDRVIELGSPGGLVPGPAIGERSFRGFRAPDSPQSRNSICTSTKRVPASRIPPPARKPGLPVRLRRYRREFRLAH